MRHVTIPILAMLLMSFISFGTVLAQDNHPDRAVCQVCAEKGATHGPEKIAAMSTHEGTTYYFCCAGCIDEFKADPEKYAANLPQFKN